MKTPIIAFLSMEFLTFIGLADPVDAQTNFWQPAGLSEYVQSLAASSTTGYVYAGTSGSGVFRSTDGGRSWQTSGLADTDILSVSLVSRINAPDIVIVGTYLLGVFRSTNNGDTWMSGGGLSSVQGFAVNSLGGIYAASQEAGMFSSVDNGVSWSAINNGLSSRQMRTVAIDSNRVLFSGTFNTGAFRSTNNGNIWSPINTGLTNNRIYALAATRTRVLIAGSIGGGCFRSTNQGENWIQSNTGLTNMFVDALTVNSVGHLFAGTTSGGAFRSTDDGEHWGEINSGLPTLFVRALTVDRKGFVFAGTPAGLFRSTQPTMGINPFSKGDISRYLLEQNYPNPFNPATKIKFSLPNRQSVRLEVFDIAGRSIDVLVDESKEAGTYSVLFDATDLPSGVYLYRISAGEFREVKKLMVLK